MSSEKDTKTQNLQEDLVYIKRVLEGDSSAYTFLQEKYQKLISSLIRRMVHNEDDVQDLSQESFIKAYKALATFQFDYSFSAWLYRIASNTCIDFLRKKRFQTVSLDQPLYNSEDDYYLEIEDNSYAPDINVLSKERKEAIIKAIDDLPDNYRQIIKLRHEKEMDYKDIADRLDIPLGTVKAHLFRARKMLLQSLKKKRHLFTEI